MVTRPGRCHLVQYGCTRPALQSVYAGPMFGFVAMCATHLEDYVRNVCREHERRTGDPEQRDPYLALCAELHLTPRPWWT